jgi:NADPH-dependent ferric siderophore reductase
VSPDRLRREPPAFRPVEVARIVDRSPFLRRITLTGAALAGFDIGDPAASVRLFIPPTADDLVLPTWNGNEFLDANGGRPSIRTLTPLRFDAASEELDVEVVLHGDGPLSAWATSVTGGERVAVSGPGRGYAIDIDCPSYVLAGDESALPAIGMLLAAIPAATRVTAIVEIRAADAEVDLPRADDVQWHVAVDDTEPGDALVEAVTRRAPLDGERVWAAGEAAAMQRIRRHLFEEQAIPRTRATIRGYWKRGGAGDISATE